MNIYGVPGGYNPYGVMGRAPQKMALSMGKWGDRSIGGWLLWG